MAEYYLRSAVESDFPAIKALIRQVRINPTGLDWRRFTVAIKGSVPSKDVGSGEIMACAQLKPVPGGLTELASLAVLPAFRQMGVARALIEYLLDRAPRPVYLTCRSRLGGLYEKFGFRVLPEYETPAYYQRLKKLAGIFMGLTRKSDSLLVMKLG